jgi:hypothetical protein
MRERLGHVPAGLVASAVVLVGAVIVGWLARGGAGAAGAAAGVLLVVVSYLISSAAVAWADSIAPRLVLPVGLGAYVFKIVLLGLVMLAVVQTGWDGTVPMGVAIIPGVIGWTSAIVWWALRQPVSRGSGQTAGVQE